MEQNAAFRISTRLSASHSLMELVPCRGKGKAKGTEGVLAQATRQGYMPSVAWYLFSIMFMHD